MTDRLFISESYRDWLTQCANLLGQDEFIFIKDMHLTNFWLFSYIDDKLKPEDAVKLYKEKKRIYGDEFPPKPENIFLSSEDIEKIINTNNPL